MEDQNYRPANIEFVVANASNMPDNLGEFQSAKEAVDFISKNVTAFNHKLSVVRFMDNFEKKELREQYIELLEVKLPLMEKDHEKAAEAFARAKKALADATELVSAITNEIKALAFEVKRGVREINLDDQFTWRVPFEGKYYFYTYIDKCIKLCKISEIPAHEKSELFANCAKNDEFFNDNFPKNE